MYVRLVLNSCKSDIHFIGKFPQSLVDSHTNLKSVLHEIHTKCKSDLHQIHWEIPNKKGSPTYTNYTRITHEYNRSRTYISADIDHGLRDCQYRIYGFKDRHGFKDRSLKLNIN